MLDGAPVRFPSALPVHRGGRRELNSGYGRTDRKVTGVTDGTAVIVAVPVFVDCGNSLQAHETDEQQRCQQRPSEPAECEYTTHASLYDACGVPSVADCWRGGKRKRKRNTRQKMRRAVDHGRPILRSFACPAQGRITFSACRPFGPRLTSNSTSQPSSRLL